MEIPLLSRKEKYPRGAFLCLKNEISHTSTKKAPYLNVAAVGGQETLA